MAKIIKFIISFFILLIVPPLTVSFSQENDTVKGDFSSVPLVNSGRFPVYKALTEANASDPFQSPDAFYIGGLPTQGWNGNGKARNTITRPGSLVVSGQPWGPYNAASLESLLMTDGKPDAQNGVCASDWRAGADHICGGDGVAQYIGVINVPARLTLDVLRYTSTSVILKTSLTADQINQLRVGMYINTNYINNTTVSNAYSSTWGESSPMQNFYQSVISGWNPDGSEIYVSGWAIPAAKVRPSGLVPGNQTDDKLDTFFSNYEKPVVFIGNPNNGSARNEYIAYKGWLAGDTQDGSDQNVGQSTATAHAFTGDEMDFRYWATRVNEVRFHGLTISIAGSSGTPMGRQALTQDSYGALIAGDIHNLLMLSGPSDANVITGPSFYVHGQEGVASDRIAQTLFGFTGWVDGVKTMNMMGWMKKDIPTVTGNNGASFHLGLTLGGEARTVDPTQNPWGEIVWNRNGANNGGISLCGGSACGIDVDYTGHVTINNIVKMTGQINAQNGLAAVNGSHIQLLAGDNPSFYSYLYAPSGASGKTVAFKTSAGGDASITAFNANYSGTVTAATLIVPFATPASSTASCTQGQIEMDASYIYTCVATNTWHRTSNGATW